MAGKRSDANEFSGRPADLGEKTSGPPELEVQAKLKPVAGVAEIEAAVRSKYFPLASAEFREYRFWEWGVDEGGVPHVMDWG